MTRPGLDALGFSPAVALAFEPFEARDLVPGRVVAGLTPRLFRVGTEADEILAEVAGRLRHTAGGPEDMPAVGDWVALRPHRRSSGPGESRGAAGGEDGAGGPTPAKAEVAAAIQAVLPRRTAFVRRAAGGRAVAQVLAANVDTAFLVMGLDADFNPRRLERALVLAREGGAEPVILLNKADLSPQREAQRAEIEGTAPGVPVCVIAAKRDEGLDALEPWLAAGRTVALLGSSGVGKSTIVNRLLGRERQKTQEVREGDQRGQHTTTRRELVTLPGGALLLDTPGLRELQLWSEGSGLHAAFADLHEIAGSCRFSDCSHEGEPGCAVRAAVGEGRLDPARLASFLKLRAELRALEVREDPLERRQQRSRWKAIQKSLRKDERE